MNRNVILMVIAVIVLFVASNIAYNDINDVIDLEVKIETLETQNETLEAAVLEAQASDSLNAGGVDEPTTKTD